MMLHHEISGDEGAPVLLLGGSLGTTLEMWDGQMPLDERLRLVRFDHRGHGGSPAPPAPYEIANLGRDVLALMDSLGLERAAAVLEAGSCEAVADGVVERWLTPDYAADNAEGRAELRAMLVATDAAGYAACCGAIERMDLRDQLPGIDVPTLVISGSDDPATPIEHQRLIAEAIPGARHEIVGPAAHLAAIQQSEAVNRLILEHLR